MLLRLIGIVKVI